MRSKIDKLKDSIRRFGEHKWVNSLTVSLAVSILETLLIELLARHSLIGAFKFMFTSPLVFIINAMLIFATLSIASLFRRRVFVMSLGALFWFVIGIANGVILLKRMTPFTINDLKLLEDGFSILTNYLTAFQIILIVLACVILIASFTLLFIKGPKKAEKVNLKRNIPAFILIAVVTFASWGLGARTGIVDSFFGNLAKGYEDNGVVYGFVITCLDTGIDKPDGYSEDEILGLFDRGELERMDRMAAAEKAEDHPNIIFLQLESFIDPDLITSIRTSEPAAPVFKELTESVSSGWLEVPAFGAGTANTEFEAMTGISAKFFGPGEYPYKSVLRDETLESIPYDLKELGYSTHAIHNHRGVFYNRNEVFANLGYDDFDSMEYMNYVEKTPKNWARDEVLIGEIMEALNKTDTKDYIYTISVEGHGKYPDTELLADPAVRVTEAATEELKWQYEYYVNMVKSMDSFLADLTEELRGFDEDVILVAYGDHLPAIDMSEDDVKSGSLYKTQYIMWSNFGMAKEDRDLCAYELGPYVLDRADLHYGTLVDYHQEHERDREYRSGLEALAYDMLYGDKYIYRGKTFKPVDMKMGLREIKVDEIKEIGGKYYIKGHNFTQYSYVTLDGNKLDTTYLSPTLLALNEEVDPDAAGELKVSQIEKYDTILSTTE